MCVCWGGEARKAKEARASTVNFFTKRGGVSKSVATKIALQPPPPLLLDPPWGGGGGGATD